MAFYNCLLLDADGTLLDFEAAEHGAIAETLEHFSLPCGEDSIQQYSEINDALWKELELGKISQNKLTVTRFEKLLAALQAQGNAEEMNLYYRGRLAAHAEIIPGADELLAELSEVATLVLVSNGIEQIQMARLTDSGLIGYFDGIYISGRVGVAKPNRKIFDIALEQLGVTNRKKVLVVGDSLTSDIKGGNAAELDTCWLNLTEKENTTGIHPNHTVQSYEELMRIVMEEEELTNVGSSEKRHSV